MQYNTALIIGSDKIPLDPIPVPQALKLVARNAAHVHRWFPLVIALHGVKGRKPSQEYVVKIDPGSRHTGLVVMGEQDNRIVVAMTLEHRGHLVPSKMLSRAMARRARRSRLWNREARFESRSKDKRKSRKNKTRQTEGPMVLPPTHESRIGNILTWVNRLKQWLPLSGVLWFENVKFDIHKLVNPDVEGVGYQHGPLQNTDLREMKLMQYGGRCAYCITPKGWDKAKRPPSDKPRTKDPLQLEHLQPSSRGGSNRHTNIGLACAKCNLQKGSMTLEEYGVFRKRDFTWVKKVAQMGLQATPYAKDASWCNIVRFEIPARLREAGFDVKLASGAQTKANRRRQNIPKEHWTDAACVGPYLEVDPWGVTPWVIQAKGKVERKAFKGNKGVFGDDLTKAFGEALTVCYANRGTALPDGMSPEDKDRGFPHHQQVGEGDRRRDYILQIRRAIKAICPTIPSTRKYPVYVLREQDIDAVLVASKTPVRYRSVFREVLADLVAKKGKAKSGGFECYSTVWAEYHQWIADGRTGPAPGHVKEPVHPYKPGDFVEIVTSKYRYRGPLVGSTYDTVKFSLDGKVRAASHRFVARRLQCSDGYLYSSGGLLKPVEVRKAGSLLVSQG